MPDLPPPQDIVVQTARLPPAAGDPAFSITALDVQSLSSSDRLDDALDSVPGFSLFRRTSSLGANPTTQGVSLRSIAGSGASRALVTLDGAPQNDPFGGWVIWTSLPPEAISGATVVRGAGAGPYGAGALTGVVALEQPANIPGQGAFDLEGGGLGYERAGGVVEDVFGPTRVFLDASGEHSDGWVPVIRGRGTVDTRLTLNDWSAAERTETDVGRAVVSERLAGFEEQRGSGTLYANSAVQGVQASVAAAEAPSAGQLGWRLQGWADGSNLVNTSASVALSRDHATLSDDQYATPALGVGMNAAVRWVGAASSLEVGSDFRDFDGRSQERLYNQGMFTGDRVAGGGELVAGVYAEGTHSVGKTLITGGVRADYWEEYSSKLIQTGTVPLDQHPGDRDGVVPSGRVGLRRDLVDGIYARSAVYSGFRPATLNELHRPFRVGNDVTEANPNLTPERLYGGEAGVGGEGFFFWDADVFVNQLANAITNVTIGHGPKTFPLAGYVPAGGTLYERENAGKVNAQGVEAETSAMLTPTFKVRAAFNYTHARVDGGIEAPQLTGRRPALTPTATATSGVEWKDDQFTLLADVRYEGSRFDDDQNTRLIKGGAGFTSRAEWALTKSLKGYVAVDNLLNTRLETGRSAAGVVTVDAPRIILLGLSYRR